MRRISRRAALTTAGLAGAVALFLALPALPTLVRPADPAARTRIGAFYYFWFPGNNWKLGYVGQRLVPPVHPALGEYDAGNPEVAEKQIALCSRHGIDFLALSWWPNDKVIDRRIRQGFLKARNIADIRFCIFYESHDLGFVPEQGAVPFDRPRTDKLLEHFDYLADHFFTHPSYLRVRGGRPVVIFYITRTWTEGHVEAVKRLREHMAARGVELYLVGDEIFWKVKGRTAGEDLETPLAERVRLFDAITSYNLYEGEFPRQKGYASESTFLRDASALYSAYRDASAGKVDFIPQVFPGYNDRVARPQIDHYAIPRAFAPGAAEGSLLDEYLNRIGEPYLDPDVKMLLVTSWNEWNEGTQIEPSEDAEPASRDSSPSGGEYTQGYPYSGYGDLYLRILRDHFVAVAGQVKEERGKKRAISGVEVWAMSGSKVLATTRTDSDGCYTLARDNLPAGRYVVVARQGEIGRSESREVEVRPAKTETGVDFKL